MLKVGIFQKTAPTELVGFVITPGIELRDVVISGDFDAEPNDTPSHFISKDGCELGVGWVRVARSGVRYVSVEIDGPMMPATMYAALFDDGDGQSYRLTWQSPEEREVRRKGWTPKTPGGA